MHCSVKPGRPDAQPPRKNFPSEFQRRTLWRAITAVSLLAIGAVAVYSIGVVADVLQFLQPVLVPVAFAGILAYLLEPIVKKLTERGTPRFRAMMWVWIGFHGILLLLFLSVAVPTISSVTEFVQQRKGTISNSITHFLSDTIDGVDKFVSRFRGKPAGSGGGADKLPAADAVPQTHTVHEGEKVATIAEQFGVTPAELEAVNTGRKVEPGVILQLPPNAKSHVPAGQNGEATQSWLRVKINAWLASNGEEIAAKVSGGLSRSVQGFVGLFGYFVGFMLVPLYLYYFLKESAAIKKGWSHYIPLRASKFKAELEYQQGFIRSIEAKLSNERFVSSAPAQVVENERKKHADGMARIAILEESIAKLG